MTLLLIVIFLGIVFDFINGFHDAANSIATIVTTRVLTPFKAVLWAAMFNFIALFVATHIIGGFGIADTVSKVVLHDFVTLPIIMSGLIAAISWNLLTWKLGIPSSSSHTLIGGFAGAAICGGYLQGLNGFAVINSGVILKIAAFIILAPVIGMVISSIITIGVLWLFKNVHARKAEKTFHRLQLVSSGLFSLGHGLNDSQKVMGIIAAAMMVSDPSNPLHLEHLGDIANAHPWVPYACFSAIAVGTMMGGWKIVKTMGSKITKVTALEGVCAETAGAATLFITEMLHIPVSTTHTVTGAIMGVGAVKRLSAVRWGVTINLLWAWILTIPVSAALAAVVYLIVYALGIK